MKNFYKPLKTTADTDGNLPKSETRKGKLYVAYLNKTSGTCATTGHYSNDYNNNSRNYKASQFTALNGTYYNNDGIPVILSPDDERMLYEEDLSEYY